MTMDRHMRESLDHWLTTPPEQDEPPIEEYDPGPECDDQGGMSEITFSDVTEPEDGAHITVWKCDLCGETFMVYPGTLHDPMRKHPDTCEGMT